MPLSFGINNNPSLHAVFYAFVILILIFTQLEYTFILEKSQESVFMLKNSNVTSIKAHLYCNTPYDDCRCSVVSIKYCLTEKHFQIGRILPLVLFVLEVSLIRELFSVTRDDKHILVYVSWIASLVVFFGILAIIYRYTCFYGYAAVILGCIGGPLFGFTVHLVASYNPHTAFVSV
jgi:hypothetical protein